MKSRKLVFHADSIRDLTASQLASRFGGSGTLNVCQSQKRP